MVINEPDDGRSYGMAKIAEWIGDEDMPLTKEDLREYEDREIRMSNDESIKFKQVLDHVEDEGEYEELQDMWKALGVGFRSFEDKIRRRYNLD